MVSGRPSYCQSGVHQITLYSYRERRQTPDEGPLGLQAFAPSSVHFLMRYLQCV